MPSLKWRRNLINALLGKYRCKWRKKLPERALRLHALDISGGLNDRAVSHPGLVDTAETPLQQLGGDIPDQPCPMVPTGRMVRQHPLRQMALPGVYGPDHCFGVLIVCRAIALVQRRHIRSGRVLGRRVFEHFRQHNQYMAD